MHAAPPPCPHDLSAAGAGVSGAQPARAAPFAGVRGLAAAVTAVLTAYVGIRAYRLSITNDEALTYIIYIKRSFTDIVLYRTPGLPDNNHLLFSLLAKVSVMALGLSEFAERLPSVAACALFLASLAGALRAHVRGPLFWAYFLFVVCNPYIIDLMSVARGYGLGIALMTAGVWVLVNDSGGRYKFLAAESLLAAAALAHFTFLLPFIAVFGWHGVNFLADLRRATSGGAVLPTAILALGLAALVRGPLTVIRDAGLLSLAAEGSTSFHVDTVQSLVLASFYRAVPPAIVTATSLACYGATVAAIAVLACGAHQRRFTPAWRALAAVTFILAATAFGSVLQHHLFGIAYLWERQAAFLIPLFGLMCALTAANAVLLPCGRRLATAVAMIFALAWLPIFATAANLRATHDWGYDADTKAMMQLLRDTELKRGRAISLGTPWFNEASISFYAEKYGMAALRRENVNPVYPRLDYYYLPTGEVAALEAAQGPMKHVAEYRNAGAVLLAREGAD